MYQKILLGLAVALALLAVAAGLATKLGVDASDYYSSLIVCDNSNFDTAPINPGACIGNVNEPTVDVWLGNNIDGLVLLSMIGAGGCLVVVDLMITFAMRRQRRIGLMIAGIIAEFFLASAAYLAFLNHFIGNFLNLSPSLDMFDLSGHLNISLWIVLSVLLTVIYAFIGATTYKCVQDRRMRAALLLSGLLVLAVTLAAGQWCLPA